MTNPKSRILAAVAGALAMGASAAWAADATQDAKIAELEAKVSALEAKQAQNGKEMAATIDSVLRDAEQRSQLLGSMGAETGAGYDNGFFIRGGPGWLLRPGVIFQFWNVTDYRTNTGGAKDDEVENGFEIHRVKLTLEGTAFTKDLEYNFTWDTNNNGGGLFLTDAWAKYMFSDDWGFRVGQFRDPSSHEWLTSDGRLMTVERSLADSVVGGSGVLGYTQGATLIYGGYQKNNPLNVEIGLTDGAGQINTNFQKGPTTFGNAGTDFGVAGRVEWKAMGNWASYRDFTAMGNKEDLLVIGLGGDWTQAGNDDQLIGTIDAQWETGALGVYAAGYIQYLRFGDDNVSDVTNFGGTIQASYMLNNQWEVFGRWSFVDFDNKVVFATGDDEDFFHEITVGVNYYLGNNGSAGHRAKVTVDLNWLPNGAPQNLSFLGYSSDSNGDNEVMIRGQFQLWL